MWILFLTMLWAAPQGEGHLWQQSVQHGDISVSSRKVADSEIHELKAESVMPLAAEQIWQVILDTEHYAEFMPYVQKARRITSDTEAIHYEYQCLHPPLVKKRDYVIKTTSEPDAAAGLWVHRFESAPNIGPAPTDEAIRVTKVEGSWTLRRLDAQHTHVTYRLFTDPGGSVPRWIANRANSRSIPELLEAVRKRAQNAPSKL